LLEFTRNFTDVGEKCGEEKFVLEEDIFSPGSEFVKNGAIEIIVMFQWENNVCNRVVIF
jgi:hypothetical protein